jgi:hypothetical protein
LLERVTIALVAVLFVGALIVWIKIRHAAHGGITAYNS